MNHLDDGTLQGFLDGELPSRERAAAAEHLMACEAYQAVRDELVQANAVVAEAMAVLDGAVPERSAPMPAASGRRWLGSGSLLKAASLTLLLAAAASAAVPGSPVREWIVRAIAPEAPEATAPVAEVPEAAPELMPMGVSMLPDGAVEVAVTDLDGATLRLVETDGESAGVSVLGAEVDPVFRTAPGRIEVRGGVGGVVTIELPRSLASARVVVDGEVYAVKEAGELRLEVPGETAAGAVVWR